MSPVDKQRGPGRRLTRDSRALLWTAGAAQSSSTPGAPETWARSGSRQIGPEAGRRVTMRAMEERRTRRSHDPEKALGYLLDAALAKSGGVGIALVDDRGRLLAGRGEGREIWSLVRAAQGRPRPGGGGWMTATARADGGRLTLAGRGANLGQGGLHAAARGVERILA